MVLGLRGILCSKALTGTQQSWDLQRNTHQQKYVKYIIVGGANLHLMVRKWEKRNYL